MQNSFCGFGFSFLVNCVEKEGLDFNVFACVGDNGVAFKAMDSMINEMKKRQEFVFGKDFSEANMIYEYSY